MLNAIKNRKKKKKENHVCKICTMNHVSKICTMIKKSMRSSAVMGPSINWILLKTNISTTCPSKFNNKIVYLPKRRGYTVDGFNMLNITWTLVTYWPLQQSTNHIVIEASKQYTSSSLNLPALHILSKSSPPEAYSITMARCVGVSNTCNVWPIQFNQFKLYSLALK